MKALIFKRTGKPGEVLSITDIPKPVPEAGEVLVKVLGSSIKPSDYLFIEGTYRHKPEFPQTAGLEGVGIIEAVGVGVTLPLNTLVAFDARGAWAEYAAVPEGSIISLPHDFPIEKAAQFYLNSFTAWGLLDEAKVKAGDWLLLTAANAAVSRIVIQLAKMRKISVIAVVRNLQQADELKTLGADVVLKQDDDEFGSKINGITAGNGVNAALDAVGGETGTLVWQSIAPRGTVIVYGLLSKEPVQFYNAQVIFKNLLIKGFGIRGYLQNQSKQQKEEMIQTLIKEIGKPSFSLPVSEVFPLEQFREALAANERPGRKGKIIFKL